ncbi:hypothetical protein BJ085DRAFT_33136 [Dimargaris cristalligena]|uniref:GATA-type domain-containing protein n=1 Tax=Dimargaris cristalligena TaxID=215637 RepID=A0A4P9ZS92_9FUNG|nr:hypothetical protein BJ085DRAFT_33136 [Dimargaris cristalligena]|eukprot:RKP36297.1 hypothetical protein BJ085DRAFT_33136 [Dimargaris cristalligena]
MIGPHCFYQTRFYSCPGSPQPIPAYGPSVSPQVVFQFAENPSGWWRFPASAVIEPTTMIAPYHVLASFDLPPDFSSQQPLVMSLVGVSEDLLSALEAVTAPTAFSLVPISTHNSTSYSVPLDYFLPCELPPSLLEEPDFPTYVNTFIADHVHALVSPTGSGPIAGARHPSQPPPSTPSSSTKASSVEGKNDTKRSRQHVQASVEVNPRTPNAKPTPPKGSSKKSSATPVTYNNNPGGTKQCQYCGNTTTPMWRRGPAGPGTLCNACGVKWKHGKILKGVTEVTGPVMDQANRSAGSSKSAPGHGTGKTPKKTLSLNKGGSTPSSTNSPSGKVRPVPRPPTKPSLFQAITEFEDPVTGAIRSFGSAKGGGGRADSAGPIVIQSGTVFSHGVQVSFGPRNATFQGARCGFSVLDDHLAIALSKPHYPSTTVSLFKETIEVTRFKHLSSMPNLNTGPVLKIEIEVTTYLTRKYLIE